MTVTKKTLLTLLLFKSLLMQQGCSDSWHKTIQYGRVRDLSPDQPLTLLDKTLTASTSVLYFDMDENMDTTEVIVKVPTGLEESLAKVFNAKVGETKTLDEWHKKLLVQGNRPYWTDVRER